MRLSVGILLTALAVALVYAGALKGGADAKVRRLLLGVALALALAAGAIWLRPALEDGDDTTRPRLCNGVQC